MTRREMLLAAGLGAFVAVWATYSLVVGPALERMETLNRVIPEKQNELESMRVKAAEFAALRDGIDGMRAKIASQDPTTELLPLVEALVNKCGLSQNLVAMEPPQTSQFGSGYTQTVVEIKMEKLTLRQIFDFISQLQSSPILAGTKRLYIKKNARDASLLDAEVEVRNLRLSQG